MGFLISLQLQPDQNIHLSLLNSPPNVSCTTLKAETWFSWRRLAKCRREEEEEEGETREGGRKDGEVKSQWTRKEIFKETRAAGAKTHGRKEERKEMASKTRRQRPCGRLLEGACVRVMEWHVSAASAVFAAQLGCHDDQYILTRLPPFFIHLSVSLSLSVCVPPPPSPSLHPTLTYINLFFVRTHERSEVDCIEECDIRLHRFLSLSLSLSLLLSHFLTYTQNASWLVASDSLQLAK